MVKINRRASTQDVSWFLDQHEAKKLDLTPPYQRNSVWAPKDRRYFLDTLFRGYPCPPIYLHKTIDKTGSAIYHVVDGKQRIETVIRFAEGKLRLPSDYGDERLNNKRWPDIISDVNLRNIFLNYSFFVEYFDDIDTTIVNEIFERMNKNSQKLTRQELRKARYDGWFSRQVETELGENVWKQIGVVTTGRARRMADAQFVAELFMIILDSDIVGFDHDLIDTAYAAYDDVNDPDNVFDVDKFSEKLSTARTFLAGMIAAEAEITNFLSSVANTYTLWALLVLNLEDLPEASEAAKTYLSLLNEVTAIAVEKKRLEAVGLGEPDEANVIALPATEEAQTYFDANQSATTEFPQRQRRLNALRKAFKIEN